jgi:hypothetical protein
MRFTIRSSTDDGSIADGNPLATVINRCKPLTPANARGSKPSKAACSAESEMKFAADHFTGASFVQPKPKSSIPNVGEISFPVVPIQPEVMDTMGKMVLEDIKWDVQLKSA